MPINMERIGKVKQDIQREKEQEQAENEQLEKYKGEIQRWLNGEYNYYKRKYCEQIEDIPDGTLQDMIEAFIKNNSDTDDDYIRILLEFSGTIVVGNQVQPRMNYLLIQPANQTKLPTIDMYYLFEDNNTFDTYLMRLEIEHGTKYDYTNKINNPEIVCDFLKSLGYKSVLGESTDKYFYLMKDSDDFYKDVLESIITRFKWFGLKVVTSTILYDNTNTIQRIGLAIENPLKK